MKTKGDVKGGGTEKTEKEKEIQRNIAIPTHPLQVSIQAPICMVLKWRTEFSSLSPRMDVANLKTLTQAKFLLKDGDIKPSA